MAARSSEVIATHLELGGRPERATESYLYDAKAAQDAGESGTAGATMGIPTAVAVGGAILGGVGLLVSILADIF